MKKLPGTICLMQQQLFKKLVVGLLLIFTICSCKDTNVNEQFQGMDENHLKPLGIVIDYPKEGTIFPPEFPAPLFSWRDTVNATAKWHIRLSAQNGEEIHHEITESSTWRPDSSVWIKIKAMSATVPVSFTIIGVNKGILGSKYSSGRTSFTFSTDSVGASVFYRAVPLPFSYAINHVNEIEWYLGNVNGVKPDKILDNVPVCANCHSFSGNGMFAMDVDYANDKGSYIIAPLKDTLHLTLDNIITWSDYKREEGELTFGLLSQISPDGRHVLSTVKDRSVFVPVDNLEYSQLFFPIKGIIAVYDRKTKKYAELPGASDKRYVQSNPNWSPDGSEILFSRAFRYKSAKIENQESVLLKIEDIQEFITGHQEFKYDLYRIPFNEGKGGQAVPVLGASNNKKSNFFARYSPDGRWVVFCQAENFMLLQRDSKLYIMPTNGGTPRLMNCNTENMNSWHSWSPNSKWLVFSSKSKGPYTQLYLTHIDENGNDSPPVLLENMALNSRAANIPEFLNQQFSDLSKMVDDFSNNALYYTRLASMSAKENRYRDALKGLEDAIKADSSYFDAYEERLYVNFILRRSRSKDDLQDRMTAKKLINRQIQQNPGDISLYVKRGHLRLLLNDYEGALQDGMNIIKLDADNYSGYGLITAIYQKMRQMDKAITYQKKMLELQPDNVNLTYNLAMLDADNRQLERALELLNEIIVRYPKNAGFYISRADLLFMKGDIVAAKADYDKAISIEPDNYMAYRARGTYYMNISSPDLAKKNYDKAISLINEKIAENNQDAPLLMARAEIMEQAGNKDGALTEYENYLKAWPLNVYVLKKIGQEYFTRKQYQPALDVYTTIVNNFPEDASGFYMRGLIFQLSGNMPKALDDMNQAILLDRSNHIYYYNRSAIKYELGDRTGSKNDLKASSSILYEKEKKGQLTEEEREILSAIKKQL
jgi:tetratricopeptide (TPR) repeat protein